MISAVVALCIFLLLVFLVARHLRADYSTGTTAVILALLIPQLVTALSAAVVPALALALLLAVVAQSAKVLAEARSARGIVVLGISLAGTQLATPLGAVVAAILAPVLALHLPAERRARNMGLLLLLLFIPVVTAFVLAYLAHEAKFDPAFYFSGPFDFAIPAPFVRLAPKLKGFCEAFLIGLLAIPTWLAILRSHRWTASAQVASALIAAIVGCALLARAGTLGSYLSAIAVLNALSFADPSGNPLLPAHAVALSGLSAVASWLFIVIPT